jgi:hypothetical protein
VSVVSSTLAPGAHADLQTTIDTPSGLTFDQVMVSSPPGSGVASDAQIADGTIVGRLDSDSTTNAITGAQCDVHVSFTAPIRKQTAAVNAPDYPAYLRTVAPGPHRLRLVADVSPSPQIPIFVNYLFDIDPLTNGVVLHTVIGDPTASSPLQTCTPQKSTNTLFGLTPSGAPLFTSPNTEPPRVLTFVFTSRPDAQGVRHTETVRATATVGTIRSETPPTPEGPRRPENLQLVFLRPTVRLTWEEPDFTQFFAIRVVTPGSAAPAMFTVLADARSFDLPPAFVPLCGGPKFVYGVAAVVTAGTSGFTEISAPDACVQPTDQRPPAGVLFPDTGNGSASDGSVWASAWSMILAALGVALSAGAALTHRRS